jgi:REP element-mobilizing transposase RayT
MRSAKPKAKAGSRVTSKANAAPSKKSTWGGKRPGAGRKPKNPNRLNTPHRARPEHEAAHPIHVVLRRAKGVPSMRTARFIREIRRQAEEVSNDDFRVIRATAATERVHLIVEADSRDALSRGMWGLTIRIARAFNKLLERSGKVWDDRYRETPLRSVQEMRAVLGDAFAASDDGASLNAPKTSIARRL